MKIYISNQKFKSHHLQFVIRTHFKKSC